MKEKSHLFHFKKMSHFSCCYTPQKSPKNLPFFQAFFFFGQTLSKPTTWQLRIEPLKQGEIERENERKEKGKLPQSELEGNQI